MWRLFNYIQSRAKNIKNTDGGWSPNYVQAQAEKDILLLNYKAKFY